MRINLGIVDFEFGRNSQGGYSALIFTPWRYWIMRLTPRFRSYHGWAGKRI